MYKFIDITEQKYPKLASSIWRISRYVNQMKFIDLVVSEIEINEINEI